MTNATYAPAFQKPVDGALYLVIRAKQTWPQAPAACLRAHLLASRRVFESLPAVSRRFMGAKQERWVADCERAIAYLEGEDAAA